MYPLTPVKTDIYIEGFHFIYYFEFDKYHFHPPERHDFWEMVYVDRGKIIAFADGITYSLEEGQAIFHKPGVLHSNISNKDEANNMLVISFSCTNECMDYFEKHNIFTLDKTSKTLLSLFMQEAQNALGKISNDYHDDSPLDFSNAQFGSAQLMKFHYVEFLVKLIRDSAQIPPDTLYHPFPHHAWAELVVAYLKQNIYSSINLNDICENFAIRKSRLSVLFKEYTGKSPMHFYADLKIDAAKKLLRENTLSVSEIAEKLNYSGINNFSRAFKEATGFAPTKYRNSILLYQNTRE